MLKFISHIFIIISLFLSFSQASLAANPTPIPIKILLVSGHDDEVWGAQYGAMKEATMTLNLTTQIFNLLKKDKRFDVHITRDSFGYTKEFTDYFTEHREDILAFKTSARNETQSQVESGAFIERENVEHNTASPEVAIRLYGINKWADENKMDAVIHVHFNDYPRTSAWKIGKHTGFVIYMPDGQLKNGFPSGQLAANIYTQMRKKYISSTYEKEKGGMIPDQKLIALGSNGTLDASVRSVLIEYGYIYEKKFRTATGRKAAYKDMAARTATGIKNYFFVK